SMQVVKGAPGQGRKCMAFAVAWSACAGVGVVPAATTDPPIDRFLATFDTRADVPADAKALIRSRWADCRDCDAEEFLTQALAVVSPKFRDGLDAYDVDNFGQCVTMMHDLTSDADSFVAIHAAVYEIKSLVAVDRAMEAGERLKDLSARSDDIAAHSYFGAEVDFLRGYCLLADLQYGAASTTLKEFLAKHADASPRLVISAKQMLVELANREAGRLGDVVDLMDFSRRRLKNDDTGEIVRTRQQKIIDLLDQLIKEAEDKEKQSSSSSSSGGGSGNPSGGNPSNPMQQSRLPGGDPGDGPNRPARRANPGEMWGSMPPAERERVLQALRASFPSRYRQLVEQYYEELAKKP
ncbi:MAG: hypothetical protein Q7R41_09705, partial [Phycisphaerales bacterium]|nr:hypothetical protein [Phycisphaerales bacterium]